MSEQSEPPQGPEERLLPIKDDNRLAAIISALEHFDIVESEGWNALDELSSRTELDSLEANPDAIFASPDGNRFQVLGNVYVTLNYGDKRDAISMADSYPFHAIGKFKEGEALIQRLLVDTSSFQDL